MVTEAFMKENEKQPVQTGRSGRVQKRLESHYHCDCDDLDSWFCSNDLAKWNLYRHFEDSYLHLKNTLGDKVDGAEFRIMELGWVVEQVEGDEHKPDTLREYVRRIHYIVVIK